MSTSKNTEPELWDADNAAWLRLPKQGKLLYGLKRAYLYNLCAKKTIRSVTLRQPGKRSGVVLIDRTSLEEWIAAQDQAQNGPR